MSKLMVPKVGRLYFISTGRRRLQAALRGLSLLCLVFLFPSSNALAQNSLSDGILALSRNVTPEQREIGGRLYGGTIEGTIINLDGDPENFSDGDNMSRFSIASTRGGVSLNFPGGNKTAFNNWVNANASQLMAILFPDSMSASVSGVDAARNYSQQLLLTTVLGTTTAGEKNPVHKSASGGLFEREWFQRNGHLPGESGKAWQGLYQMDGIHLSLQGRYAQQHEAVDTRSMTISADFHPGLQIKAPVEWRVGVDARSGLLYSRSAAMDLGSLDVGAGVWTSVRKDFSRVRLGAGSVFQGSHSLIPSSLVGSELAPLAEAMNDRGIQYDVSYGAIAGFLTSDRTSLNVKALETRSISSDGNRPPSRLVLTSFSYLFSGHTPVDVGYKISTGDGFKSQSVFVQGNFRW